MWCLFSSSTGSFNIGWHKPRLEPYSVDVICSNKDLSLSLPTQKHQSDTYDMRSSRKYPALVLTFYRALLLTKFTLLSKEDVLLLCIRSAQHGSCTWAPFLNPAWICCTLLSLVGHSEPSPFERGFGWWPPLGKSFSSLNVYTSLKALGFSEQLAFTCLEIPDAGSILQGKII